MVAEPSTTEPKTFHPGQIVDGKWRIKSLLGKGACGVVYKVEDRQRRGYCAAMKVEHISPDFDQTLRLEIGVLNKLKQQRDMLRILDYGKRKTFTYMVTTLCGKDLMALRCKIKRGFNDCSALRIAVFTLYSLKQTHEAGYVHRDVKPGNVITAANRGRDSRFLLLIDFGMARSFVTTDPQGRKYLRMMRRRIPLRGTIRYCSLNVHDRVEQGRCDDLIAMIYMLVEVTLGVPWHSLKDEKEVMAMKKATKDSELFEDLPEELNAIFQYVKTLNYHDRPSYMKIYNLLMTAIKRLKISFLDPYEWEDEEIEKEMIAEKEREAKEKEEKNAAALITKIEPTNEPVENNNVKEKEKEVNAGSKLEKKTSKTNVPSPMSMEAHMVLGSKEGTATNTTSMENEGATPPTTNERSDSSPMQTTDKDVSSQQDRTSKSDQPSNTPSKKETLRKELQEAADVQTAIDYELTEYKTKKALPRDELQFQVYPSLAPINFSESTITF